MLYQLSVQQLQNAQTLLHHVLPLRALPLHALHLRVHLRHVHLRVQKVNLNNRRT